MIFRWFKHLDQILRGQATTIDALQEADIDVPIGGLSIVIAMLAVFYGLCMGAYAMIRTDGEAIMQLIASAVKLPLLFFLTLIVTLPSLYVFNALVGSRLTVQAVLRLLVAALGVMLAVLASLGPIVVFFSVSTDSYPFMKLLNVAAAGLSGFLGLAFLLRTMHRLVLVQSPVPTDTTKVEVSHTGNENQPDSAKESETEADAHEMEPPSALDRLGDPTNQRAKAVFQVWVAIFALVGAQMSWVLRPFIGDPALKFEWWRQRGGNFFIDVYEAIVSLFS
jgi:hypothetical protein